MKKSRSYQPQRPHKHVHTHKRFDDGGKLVSTEIHTHPHREPHHGPNANPPGRPFGQHKRNYPWHPYDEKNVLAFQTPAFFYRKW